MQREDDRQRLLPVVPRRQVHRVAPGLALSLQRLRDERPRRGSTLRGRGQGPCHQRHRRHTHGAVSLRPGNYWPGRTTHLSCGPAGPSMSSIQIIRDFASPQEGFSRTLRVYTPDGYDPHSDRRYPILYLHDGQNVFAHPESAVLDTWCANRVLDGYVHEGQLEPWIVVAVDHGLNRLAEYSPWDEPRSGVQARAEPYVRFFVETLKPFVDQPLAHAPGARVDRRHGLVARRPDVALPGLEVPRAVRPHRRHVPVGDVELRPALLASGRPIPAAGRASTWTRARTRSSIRWAGRCSTATPRATSTSTSSTWATPTTRCALVLDPDGKPPRAGLAAPAAHRRCAGC